MAEAQIYRSPSTPKGTFGTWWVGGRPVCLSVERPWDNNKHETSCIPAGTYHCKRHISEKFPNGDTWEVTNVPDREGILIHPANRYSDLLGCIGPGMMFGQVDGDPAVLNSKTALANLNGILPDEFDLTIIEINGN